MAYLKQYPNDGDIHGTNIERIQHIIDLSAKAKFETITQEEFGYVSKINGLGYLTTDSQAGCCITDLEGTLEERAYVSGFIRAELLKKFELRLPEFTIVEHPNENSTIVTREILTSGKIKNHTRIPKLSKQAVCFAYESSILRDGHWGKEFPDLILDLNEWAFVSIIDMEYGKSAITEGGLFVSIIDALTKCLE